MKRNDRKKLLEDLKSIDSRLKMSNLIWNDEVKAAFQDSGSFDFDNLVYEAPNIAQALVERFKLIKS